MNFINTFFNGLLHLVYPEICAGCGSDLVRHKQLLCAGCIELLPLTNFHLHAGNPVEKVFEGRLPLIAATSLLYFNKKSIVQELLHQLKYKGKKDIGYYFGRKMGENLQGCSRFRNIEAIVPLPLHIKRRRKRGYNQAEVIGNGISDQLKIPVFAAAVYRTSQTETQTHKGRTERWQNMEGRFEVADRETLAGKHVLLIDDVITTGATLESCGRALQKIRGLQLSIASLAFTT